MINEKQNKSIYFLKKLCKMKTLLLCNNTMYDSVKNHVDTRSQRSRLRLAFQQNVRVSSELYENFVQMTF